MPIGRTHVASFEEMRQDKIGLAPLIGTAYYQEIEMTGNNGIPMSELLMRLVLLRNFTENKISPYLPDTDEYWTKVKPIKERLTVEFARMPQYHTAFIRGLSEWDKLLMKEESRLNLLLTRNVAARI